MFGSLSFRGPGRRIRLGRGLVLVRGEIGFQPGDLRITLDETPPDDMCMEPDGSTITDGVRDFPHVAKRLRWMVSGGNLILPNFRGRGLRIWDHGAGVDPDAASRDARVGDAQTGDYPGTPQGYQIQQHVHTIGFGANQIQGQSGGSVYRLWSTGTSASYNAGGNETRMTNIGVSIWMVMG